MRIQRVEIHIVVGQGNEHIKELLRDNGIKIGTNKTDFLANMIAAIRDGSLTQGMIEEWLDKIEGWGNQHIYLYEPPTISFTEIAKKIKLSALAGLLNQQATHQFPDAPTLTTITLTKDSVSFIWHEGHTSWIRVKGRDYAEQEGLDIFEYRAFRKKSNRTVTRFEWQIGKPYCSIFMQQPHEGTLHADVIRNIWDELIKSGLIVAPLAPIYLSEAVKNFKNIPKRIVSRVTKMMVDGGYVELGSTLPDNGGIADVGPVNDASRAINEEDFPSANGTFRFNKEIHTSLSRDIKMDIVGSESRIKIWVQCKREDVYEIVSLVWKSVA